MSATVAINKKLEIMLDNNMLADAVELDYWRCASSSSRKYESTSETGG